MQQIPEDLQGDAKKRDEDIKKATSKVTPIWLNVAEDGTTKINTIKLARSIIKENPMVNNKFSEDGYWYDKKNGYWLTDTSTHIDKVITNNMLSVEKWSTNTFSSVKKLVSIQTTSEANRNPFDHSNPYLISFKNGTYNVQTGEQGTNSDKNYILQGHSYDLVTETGKAPQTNKWFEESFGSEEASNVVKTFIGYSFVRNYADFQKYLILFGNGGDGKSTILNYLITLIGSQNTSNVSLKDLTSSTDKFATSQLYQKDVNYCADIGNEFIKQTDTLKNITGDDRLSGQFKNKDRFDFWNHAKLIFSANALPTFNDFSNGFMRRPIIARVHKIKDFSSKYSKKTFSEERGAFVYECLCLYKQLLDGNYPGQLDKWGFPTTDEMQADLHNWKVENDLVSRWLSERCDMTDKKAFEKNVYVYDDYKRFCIEEGGHPLGKKKFNASLKSQGIEVSAQKKINGNKYRGYRGIRLLKD